MNTIRLSSQGILPEVPSLANEGTKRTGAAQDFESILLAQIFQSFREANSGWLGGGDGAADTAFALGEQQLAQAISANGGLGISRILAHALQEKDPAKPISQAQAKLG